MGGLRWDLRTGNGSFQLYRSFLDSRQPYAMLLLQRLDRLTKHEPNAIAQPFSTAVFDLHSFN